MIFIVLPVKKSRSRDPLQAWRPILRSAQIRWTDVLGLEDFLGGLRMRAHDEGSATALSRQPVAIRSI